MADNRTEALTLFPGVECAHGYAAMTQILQLAQRLTAAFVASDMAAMEALQALGQHGLRVPQNMALVSFAQDADGVTADIRDLTERCLTLTAVGHAL